MDRLKVSLGELPLRTHALATSELKAIFGGCAGQGEPCTFSTCCEGRFCVSHPPQGKVEPEFRCGNWS